MRTRQKFGARIAEWTSMGWNETSASIGLKEGRERSPCMFKFPAPARGASVRACWMWVRAGKCVLGACVCAPAAAAAAAAAAVVEVVVAAGKGSFSSAVISPLLPATSIPPCCFPCHGRGQAD